MNDAAEKISQAAAADKCARDAFAQLDRDLPEFASKITPAQRGVLLNCMARCFLTGVVEGVDRLSDAMKARRI